MADLDHQTTAPTIIYKENQGVIELAKNPKYQNPTKYLNICHDFVCE